MDDLGAAEAASAKAIAAKRPQGTGRTVLFSAMKNEAPFLLEWVAYHKVIGFDEIVICSNPSNDGTEELLDALAKSGEIKHLRATVPPGASPQFRATQAFEQKIGFRDGDWYMWLDGDEFLNVHVGDRTVGALVDAIGDRQVALINWRIFGSSGHAGFPGRFVSEDFTGAAKPEFDRNCALKSIFRCSPAFRGFARHGIHRPLMAKDSALRFEDVVVGTGRTASPGGRAHKRWLAGRDIVHTSRVYRSEAGWALAQVNHYIVRTKDYFRLKKLRGRGYMPRTKIEENNRHNEDFFAQHDRNEAQDSTILHWQQAVGDELARLMARPKIKAAKAVSDGLVAKALADLEETSAAEAASPVAPADTASRQDVDRAADPASLGLAQSFGEAGERLLLAAQAKARVILEYGVGSATVQAAKAGRRVISVECDLTWADRMAAHLASLSTKATVHAVDIGPTLPWGFPRKMRQAAAFPGYALSVWDRPDFQHPDLVLIDGRFRAACLAAVKMRATRPVTVLFDDYVDRNYYHAVEKLAVKDEVAGRMARFTVTPGPIPPEMLTQVIGWFTDPR